MNYVRSYTKREGDWEEDRQLLLCVYRITKHATTGLSPYEVFFGVDPPSLSVLRLPGTAVSESLEYSGSLKPMILELREMLEANIVESAKPLCQSYQGEGTCETPNWTEGPAWQSSQRQVRYTLNRAMDCCQLEEAIHCVAQGGHCHKKDASQSSSPLAPGAG